MRLFRVPRSQFGQASNNLHNVIGLGLHLHRKDNVEHYRQLVSIEIFKFRILGQAMHKQATIRPQQLMESSFFERSSHSIRNRQISFEESQSRLMELRNQVELSRSRLEELVEGENFENQARRINREGMELIKMGQIVQAVIVISQAEKILEHAVSKGKEIQRNLIISVLHNLACCHQQTWSLQKCSSYIQALIYNLNCEIKQISDSSSENRLIVVEEVGINRELAKYYLLFCAINSQLKRNDAALIAAKKGNMLLRSSSIVLAKLAAKSRVKVDPHSSQILKELGRIKASTEDMNTNNLMEITQFYLYIWKNKCSFPNSQLRSLMEKLKSFSIGNIMQIEPKDVDFASQPIWNELQYEKVLERVVVISMSFFTMATELRLLATRLSDGDKQKARELSEFRQSQCYHLISIIILVYYIPFDLLFLQHILTSFTHHYDIRLEPTFSKRDPRMLFTTLLERDEIDEVKQNSGLNCEKDHSSGPSRNSLEETKSMHSKLESDVRASLKSQRFDNNKDMLKLNNYFYIRDQKGLFHEQRKESQLKSKRLSHHSRNKMLLKRACATSKQSAQKTPIGYSPAEMSPKRNKMLSKASKSGITSKNGSLSKQLSPKHAKKTSNVIDEYFQTGFEVDSKKKKRKMTSKGRMSKENRQTKASPSPCNHQCKISTKNQGDKKNKQNRSQLKGLKSPAKLKNKLQQAKSKKKLSTIHNYQ